MSRATLSTSVTTVLFDVNETLSDLTPLDDAFIEAGLTAVHRRLWFASVLRDGIALAATGAQAGFAEIARAVATDLLPDAPEAVDKILSGFNELGVHDDVPDTLAKLNEGGFTVATLSNGAASVAEGLLERNGLTTRVRQILSVADAGAWKPASSAYHYGCQSLGVFPEETVLVAVHPWDIHGANNAGLRSAYLDRHEVGYPEHFSPPTYTLTELGQLPDRLVEP